MTILQHVVTIGSTMSKFLEGVRPCNCGSGLASWWEYDAQGIELDRVCSQCVDEKLRKYRPEILTGYTQADVDEPIEED